MAQATWTESKPCAWRRSLVVATAAVLALAASQSRASECDDWSTPEFIGSATTGEVNECLLAGADPMAKDGKGVTPLHRAAALEDGHAIVEILLAAGADPDAPEAEYGLAPLHGVGTGAAAVSPMLDQALQWLPEWMGWFSRAPAFVAVLVDAGADPNARDVYGATPPDMIVEVGRDPAVVVALVEAVADPNARDAEGVTPRHVAAKHGDDPAIVELLLETVTDPNMRTDTGMTPLHWAAAYASDSAVAVLLAAGADLEARSNSGLSPLHAAAMHATDPAVATVLLEARADLEAQDGRGRTPLLSAAVYASDPAVAMALLEAGADWTARNDEGYNVWDLLQDNASLKGTVVYERMRALAGE